MSYTHSERLTALDATFLALEDAHHPMHVGAVAVFDGGPLVDGDGGFDIERIRRGLEAGLWRAPRFRQRLEPVPVLGPPVWVDDAHFNLHYHVRHTALPAPGDERQLKRLAGRVLSQQLDRGKPLWELWFVEGLEGHRFAVVAKLHHCLVDGISALDLLALFTRGQQDAERGVAKPWLPRAAPGTLELVAAEAWRRATSPLELLSGLRTAAADPWRAWRQVSDVAAGVRDALAATSQSASTTSLDVPIGSHRRFDWMRVDLDAVRDVRRRLGGTVNDVVLAMVSGALRRFLAARGDRVRQLDLRALVPVSTRRDDERGALGNRVSLWVVPLPVAERDPRRRHGHVVETLRQAKRSHATEGGTFLEELSDHLAPGLFVNVVRRGLRGHAFNLVVTNVPGPADPISLFGARLEAIHPVVPLPPGQALGIALVSYAGGLFFGLHADWDAVPDLHELVTALQEELEVLAKLDPAPVRRRRKEA